MPVKTRAIEKIKRDTVLKKKDLAAGPNETQTKKSHSAAAEWLFKIK